MFVCHGFAYLPKNYCGNTPAVWCTFPAHSVTLTEASKVIYKSPHLPTYLIQQHRAIQTYLYCTFHKNRVFKVLLVLTNAPGQPQDLCLTYPNIKAKYLSNQTTSPLLLLNHRVITMFKHYYTCHISSIISDASESQTFVSIQ